MEVGVRQLRNELRRWLDVVEGGDEVVITERGKPVARLVGVTSPTSLERLVEAGVVRRARKPATSGKASPRLNARGSVSEMVKDQRR